MWLQTYDFSRHIISKIYFNIIKNRFILFLKDGIEKILFYLWFSGTYALLRHDIIIYITEKSV